MSENEELSSLEKVRQRLYDPQAPKAFEEPQLRERPAEQSRGWEKLKTAPELLRKEAEHVSGPARFFIVALFFFLVTGGGAIFYLVYGGRAISTNNVNVAVQGPTSIASGDTVPLLVTIENRNPVAIRGARLSIDFPEGTKSADDATKPLTLYTDELGDIPSGGKVEASVRATVFGSEGQHITLPLKIEYRTENSSAVFVKNKQYSFIITSSPISVNVSALSQASAGQTVTLDVSVRSNAATTLANVGVVAQFPFGFTPTSISPPPANGTVFYLGSLTPGEERRISITGVVNGDNNDERIFTFSAGTLKDPAATALAASFTTKDASIRLTKPFLATTLSIGGDTTASPVITSGVPVPATLTWSNSLATPITNARVTVAFSGDAFDPTSVTGGGFYRSSDRTVLFDTSTNPGLAQLQPGDTGQGIFNFRAKPGASGTISLKVSIAGQRLSETNVPETVTSTLSRTVKVGTNLTLNSRAVRTAGPFTNIGPLPPAVDKESTYTVLLTLVNTGNTVAGTQVTAALPSYVRFTGATSPADGSVSYSEVTRTVTWAAGDIASGGAGKTAAFQVAITPSISQQNTAPVLLYAQQVTGVDRFTSRPITGSMKELTTEIVVDPAYTPGIGKVQ
jgi:hypothetical protein